MGNNRETVAYQNNMATIVRKMENLFTQSTSVPLQNLTNVRNKISFINFVPYFKDCMLVPAERANKAPTQENKNDRIIQKAFDITLTSGREALRAQSVQFRSGIYLNIHVTVI